MDHEQALSRVLPKLSQRIRAAFAAACAERTRMVYESMEPDDSDFFFDALLLRSLLGAMRSITDPTTEPAEDASSFAVDMAGNTTTSKKAADAAQAEEEKWQLAVLDVVRQWPDDKIDVDAFEPVGWTDDEGFPEPKWLQRFYEGSS